MVASSLSAFDQISALRPKSILDVVPRECFLELGQPGYGHIGNGNCYEWKYAIAKYLQPKSILEIGVRYGYSLCSMISGSGAVGYVEGWDSEIYRVGSNRVASGAIGGLQRKFTFSLLHVDSKDVKQPRQQFDLVHIDSSHTYEGCAHDLKLCIGHAKAILVDDTLTCPDDMKAVKEFCWAYESLILEVIHIPSHVGESLILLR